jgi:hypothetical protein
MCSIYGFAARLQDGLKHLSLSRHPVFTDAVSIKLKSGSSVRTQSRPGRRPVFLVSESPTILSLVRKRGPLRSCSCSAEHKDNKQRDSGDDDHDCAEQLDVNHANIHHHEVNGAVNCPPPPRSWEELSHPTATHAFLATEQSITSLQHSLLCDRRFRNVAMRPVKASPIYCCVDSPENAFVCRTQSLPWTSENHNVRDYPRTP